MTKDQAVEVLKLFIGIDIYQHPDYNPSMKMSQNDQQLVQKVKFLKPNDSIDF